MKQIVAVVQILWDLAVELLYLVDGLRVDMTLVQLKVLLEAHYRKQKEGISEIDVKRRLTWELFFEILAHVVSIDAVAVANGEEMQA